MVIPENALKLPPEEKLPQRRGGFGTVYIGRYRGHMIAIKVMRLYANDDLKPLLSVSASLYMFYNRL